jgi:hypothetical protein
VLEDKARNTPDKAKTINSKASMDN